ncbi:hypothetical protein L1049_007305 [Liquidambar formosana]|uniref:Remorin N-terminal domain-containing protein n=1 Tax=Liquidambar formosana TaxID=63359 RepID=A0AAP0RIJ2_LIQFO
MGEEEPKKVEPKTPSITLQRVLNDVAEEKTVIPFSDDKVSHPPVEKVPDPTAEKHSGGSIDRDVVLARIEREKSLALIRAWEESEKIKAENKTYKSCLPLDHGRTARKRLWRLS